MASRFEVTAEHEVTCPVCFEFFVDPNIPRVLECSHICCQVCLHEIMTVNQPGELITCPMRCEKKTLIPADGITALKTNLQLRNLAEQHPNYTKGLRRTVPKCVHHEGENTHLFCSPCNKLVCQYCATAFHQGTTHEVKDVKVTTAAKKQELQKIVTDINKEIGAWEQTAQKMKEFQKIIQTNLQSEEQRIDQFADEIIATRDALKAELQNQGELKLAKMRSEVECMEKHADRLKGAHEVASKTLTSSDYAYITQHVYIVDKIKKLRVKEVVPPISKTQYAVKFVQRNDVPDVKLGRLVRPRELELVQKIGGFDAAYRLTGSPNALLAVSDIISEEVIVYHKQNGEYTKQVSLSLSISNTHNPYGVAVCADGQFLVARITGIEMFSTTGEYQRTIKTTIDKSTDTFVCSVVTMADGRILAGDTVRCVITLHHSTGSILQTIKTNIEPRHIALTKDTNIAMSNWESNKVSVLDIESGQETLSIDIPRVVGICYDKQTKCLLTVRSEPANVPGCVRINTGVIEQYCCITGRLVACPAQGLYHPESVALMSDGNLAVTDKKTVKIYKMI